MDACACALDRDLAKSRSRRHGFFQRDRLAEGSHGTDAISAAGAAGNLADLFSIYNCPATNITPANVIANIALAKCGTSFILCLHRNTCIKFRVSHSGH
jgi:hypothetical protein